MMTAVSDTQDVSEGDHDCVVLSHAPPSGIDENLILFTEGSAQILNGCKHTGWAICLSHVVA